MLANTNKYYSLFLIFFLAAILINLYLVDETTLVSDQRNFPYRLVLTDVVNLQTNFGYELVDFNTGEHGHIRLNFFRDSGLTFSTYNTDMLETGEYDLPFSGIISGREVFDIDGDGADELFIALTDSTFQNGRGDSTSSSVLMYIDLNGNTTIFDTIAVLAPQYQFDINTGTSIRILEGNSPDDGYFVLRVDMFSPEIPTVILRSYSQETIPELQFSEIDTEVPLPKTKLFRSRSEDLYLISTNRDSSGGTRLVSMDMRGKLVWNRLISEHPVSWFHIYSPWKDDSLLTFINTRLAFKKNDTPGNNWMQVIRIDPEDGDKISETWHKGRFNVFEGRRTDEIGYAGLIGLSTSKAKFVTKSGQLENQFSLVSYKRVHRLKLLKLSGNRYGFISQINDWSLALYDFNGNILAVTSGRDAQPTRLGTESQDPDNLIVWDDQMRKVLKLVPNGPFWWVWRWRWVLVLLVLPPIITALNSLVVSRRPGRERKLTLLEDYKRLQEEVELRTKEISEKNEQLNLEVSQRIAAQTELRSRHTHLEAIYNHIQDAVVTVDESLRITSANKLFRNLYAPESEEVVGADLKSLIIVEEPDSTKVLDDLQSGEPDTRYQKLQISSYAGEKRIVNLSVSRLELGDELCEILLIFNDVSDLYSVESEGDEKFFPGIIGKSEKLKRVFHLMAEIAPTDTTVLITGGSGTGKELVATAIHNNSMRAGNPFHPLNCAALPDSLLESELFGYTKGAFTGAIRDTAGVFEAANGGTVFLDEIGDVSATMQAKLLRILQEGEFSRLGETRIRICDTRIIAATNQNLAAKVSAGEFREDLYYRLKVFTVDLPALIERKTDIPLLVEHFIEHFNKELSRNVSRADDSVIELLLNHTWQGNVRELKNTINAAMVLCHDDVLRPAHFPSDLIEIRGIKESTHSDHSNRKNGTINSKEDLIELLDQNNWNITKSAKRLGISRTYLYRKIKDNEIEIPR